MTQLYDATQETDLQGLLNYLTESPPKIKTYWQDWHIEAIGNGINNLLKTTKEIVFLSSLLCK